MLCGVGFTNSGCGHRMLRPLQRLRTLPITPALVNSSTATSTEISTTPPLRTQPPKLRVSSSECTPTSTCASALFQRQKRPQRLLRLLSQQAGLDSIYASIPRDNNYPHYIQFTQSRTYSDTPIITTSPGSTQNPDLSPEENNLSRDIGSPLPQKRESEESEDIEEETQLIQSQSGEMPPPTRRGAGDTAPHTRVGAPYPSGIRGRGGGRGGGRGRGFPEQKLDSGRSRPRNSRYGDGPRDRPQESFQDTTTGRGTFPWSQDNDRVTVRRVRFEDNERGGSDNVSRDSGGIGGAGRDDYGRDNVYSDSHTYSRAKRGGFSDRQSNSGFSSREGPRFRNLTWKVTPQDNEGPHPSGVDGDGSGDGDSGSGSGSGSGLPQKPTSARPEQHYPTDRGYPDQMMVRGSQENSEERARDTRGYRNQEGGRREARAYTRGDDFQSRDRNREVPERNRTWDRDKNRGTNSRYWPPERDWGDRGRDSRRFPSAVSRTQWGPNREEESTYTERRGDYGERRRSLSPDRHDRRGYEFENRRRYEYENKRSNEYGNGRKDNFASPVKVSRVFGSTNERKRDYHTAPSSHPYPHTTSYESFAVSHTKPLSLTLTKPAAVTTRMEIGNAQHKPTAIDFSLTPISISQDSHPHQVDKQRPLLMDTAKNTPLLGPEPTPQDGLSDPPALPIPSPTPSYMITAHEDPAPALVHLPNPPILVVLDLNGTLLYRSKKHHAYISSKHPRPRPYLRQFLEYLFSHFHVMIWSSAQPQNVTAMLNATFSPEQRERLVAVWARDTLGLTPTQMRRKIVVYKRLDKVWAKLGVEKQVVGAVGTAAATSSVDSSDGNGENAAPGPWGQHNTILIDDSAVKATAQPYNLVEISSWEGGSGEDRALVEAAGYLEELRRGRWSDVSAYMRAKPFRVDDGWGSSEKVGEWFWGEENGEFRQGKVAAKKAMKKAKRSNLEAGLQVGAEVGESEKRPTEEIFSENVMGEGMVGLRDDFPIATGVASLARESEQLAST